MNLAIFVPEYTVAVWTLRQNGFVSRQLAVFCNEGSGVRVDIVGDDLDFFTGQEGPAVSFTAISAFLTLKNLEA